MLGKTAVIGYAGRDSELHYTGDSELRYTPQGKPYCRFSVGMTEYYNSASGERREKLTWYSCKLWGTRAEKLSGYIKKGTHLFVEGRVGCEAFKDRETGEARSVITINVTRVQLLDKRAAGSSEAVTGETEEADDEQASATTDDWFDIPI
jgi:single-strand DNA-binding protein